MRNISIPASADALRPADHVVGVVGVPYAISPSKQHLKTHVRNAFPGVEVA